MTFVPVPEAAARLVSSVRWRGRVGIVSFHRTLEGVCDTRRTFLAAAGRRRSRRFSVPGRRGPGPLPGKTKFAVNVEMWWGRMAVPQAARRGGQARLHGRRVLAVAGKDIDAVVRDVPAEQADHRPVHRVGLHAGAERPEESRPLRRGDRGELRGRQEAQVQADVRRRRRRHRPA